LSPSKPSKEPLRCPWAGNDPMTVAYHDDEWGVPQHDDRRLFEKITLEGAQAGLSWSTILRKREGYRAAFADFDPAVVARFTAKRVEHLLANPEIIRNRAKVESTITNARAVLTLQRELGTLDAYLWGFVDGTPLVRKRGAELPAQTPLSVQISKDLKRRGFRFVGPTTVYALMQAMGLVNDHDASCFRYRELAP